MNIVDEFIDQFHGRSDAVFEDGELRCPTCHDPVTRVIMILNKKRRVPIACSCQVNERRKHEEQLKRERRNRERQECFSGALDLAANRLSESSDKEAKIARKYADAFEEMLADGQGLLFMGSPGTGKTYLSSCIANEIIDKDFTVHFINASMIPSILFSAKNKEELIQQINTCHLLIIDDLGSERGNQYAAECIYNLVNTRYNTAMPMIVTTNLTPANFNSDDITLKRIYERISQRCYPVAFTGINRRMVDAVERKNKLDKYFMED